MFSSFHADRDVPTLSVVVPLYDEAANIDELYRRLSLSLTELGLTYEILLVDDGSRDGTSRRIDELAAQDAGIVPLHLSRNFGHQSAICAGIEHARGQAVVLMDGDLQDPPELLEAFVQSWRDGSEVVYAIRTRRKEGIVKRAGYTLFYRLLRAISDLDIPLDSGDFCLMDRKVVDVLKHLPERMRFVRGLRTFVGFRQTGLRYERAARSAGESKYSFRALVRLAIDGLISFSSYPMTLVTYLGLTSAGLALILTVWVLTDSLCSGTAPRGWASTILVVLYMSTVQLISLGIMGEYVRRIFLEVKGRPTYIVRPPAPIIRPATPVAKGDGETPLHLTEHGWARDDE
ncbi:MAG: glycosyltransferase family 2 protein [Gemmataceae bacterium]|nr:glycosyltransferase family 2 protein [Gemmataceae bacterium]